ncbi:WD40/YVTN/BNR-like repeat-containing protein [Spirosoma agri]|uniref:WD40/YVTN/BNR-like repeat-containing protein n=1 Tax=Spirosoma agri TaxID=1987381 RepID=UPI001BAEE92D|nr:exo-alpha-sialidase [Spirosoma agri]
MDISSRYFSQLKRKDPAIILNLWAFLVAAYRVGKLVELLSFVVWECRHRVGLFSRDRYVKFTDDTCPSLGVDTDLAIQSSEFLNREGFCFEPVPIDWKYCFEAPDGTLWGTRYSDNNKLVYSIDGSISVTIAYEFLHSISSLYINSQGYLFVCVEGTIYKSSDCGLSFKKVLSLSSSISYFLFNNGMTELPDRTLFIGEYGSIWRRNNWQNLAFLYYSTDGGDTWTMTDFLVREGANKHIHVVKYCERLAALLLTDGDNKKRAWINSSLTHFDERTTRRQSFGWRLVTKFHHQTGGYLAVTETKNCVLLGSDYLGGTNFIVRTLDGRRFEKSVMPDPYRRSPIMNMTTTQSRACQEVWAFSYSCLSTTSKSLLMCSKDDGKTWARVIEFDGTKNEVRLVSTSQRKSGILHIAITTYGDCPESHRHQVYKLMHKSARPVQVNEASTFTTTANHSELSVIQ